MPHKGQVLTDISHGGHVIEDTSQQAANLAATREDITPLKAAVAGIMVSAVAAEGVAAAAVQPEEVLFETPFDYLFPDLKDKREAHLPTDNPTRVAAALMALGDEMVESSEDELQTTNNSTIPPVYTYWGQFIDHDLTANTDRDSAVSDITKLNLTPIPVDDVVKKLKNLRQPTLNLDSVYGDGPTFDPKNPTQAASFYDGVKFRVGTVATNPPPSGEQPIAGVPIPPDADLERDLPRIGALIRQGVLKEGDFLPELRRKPNFKELALIADARNDENLIVAQFHTAFLRFHNAVVDWVKANEPEFNKKSDTELFERAQQLTRWHYQWLVVNDYLKTVTLAGIVDKILFGGPKHYILNKRKPFMPLEFSVAAFRFGHTMVRATYDYNRNFGRPGNVTPFNLLFAFTGNGEPKPFPLPGWTEVLPFNWIIEWDRFIDKGSSVADHFARKIDTRLALPLKDMANMGNDKTLELRIKLILKNLARRNLLRGYLLSIPTGQSVAQAMGIAPLTTDELRQGNSDSLNAILDDENNKFLERTPLWYYVLKEAEVRANGNSLGELGSRIVCETIIGQLLNDPDSYLNQKGGWNPSKGAKFTNGDPIVTIGDFIRFTGIPA